jgi:hypothetical protein
MGTVWWEPERRGSEWKGLLGMNMIKYLLMYENIRMKPTTKSQKKEG